MRALMLIVIASVHLGGCASQQLYDRGPLFEQRLVARPGYPGKLTNQVCRAGGGHHCTKMDVKPYDLTDPGVREQLRGVKLICNVAGVRYRVCSDRPGLCSQTEEVKKFLGITISRKMVEIGYIPAIEDWQVLVDGATWCMAQDSELGREMFR